MKVLLDNEVWTTADEAPDTGALCEVLDGRMVAWPSVAKWTGDEWATVPRVRVLGSVRPVAPLHGPVTHWRLAPRTMTALDDKNEPTGEKP